MGPLKKLVSYVSAWIPCPWLTSLCVCSQGWISRVGNGTFQSIAASLRCKLTSCSHLLPPAALCGTAWLSARTPNRQMAVAYSALAKKKVRNHFYEAQGGGTLTAPYQICGFKKKKLIHRPGPGLFLLPPSLQSRPDSERYCVVDLLSNGSVHLLYRQDVWCDVGLGTRYSSFFLSAQGKDRYLMVIIEKESYLFKDTHVVPQRRYLHWIRGGLRKSSDSRFRTLFFGIQRPGKVEVAFYVNARLSSFEVYFFWPSFNNNLKLNLK